MISSLDYLLGFDSAAIIENFLIQEAKLSYNEYLKLDKKDIIRMFDTGNDVETQSRIGKCKYGVDFSDFFITNSVMEGSNAHDFVQTFNVKVQESGPELDPSNYITEDCLKRVEWRYTKSQDTIPTIGYLRLTKMNDEVVEIDVSGVSEVERGEVHYLEGAFIITNFVMTSLSIDSLRLAGSENGRKFLTAVEHYSLWVLTSDAKKLLKKAVGKSETCWCYGLSFVPSWYVRDACPAAETQETMTPELCQSAI